MLMLGSNTKREWPYNDSWYLRMGITNPNHGMWAWEGWLNFHNKLYSIVVVVYNNTSYRNLLKTRWRDNQLYYPFY